MSATERNRGTINEGEREARKPTITIIGSFKHKDRIDEIIDIFEQQGIVVLAPPKGKVSTKDINIPSYRKRF